MSKSIEQLVYKFNRAFANPVRNRILRAQLSQGVKSTFVNLVVFEVN